MSYTGDEIRALLDHWLSLRYSDKLWVRARYADLGRALDALNPDSRKVVLLTGALQLSVRETGEILSMSKSTVSRRYLDATEWMADYLSGAEVI